VRLSKISLSPQLIVLLVVVVGMTVAYVHRSGDFVGYLTVGEVALQGGDIYRDTPRGMNTWPPFFGLLCIPLALLARISLYGTRFLWLMLNLAALVFSWGAAVRLVHGRKLLLTRSSTSAEDGIDIGSSVALLPLLFCACWILSNFEHIQINILIFAITLFGLLFHRERRDVLAGLLIGVAAAMKVMPILFVPYFVWRRQWRAALFITLFAIGWSLLPATVYGWKTYQDQLAGWRENVHPGWGVTSMNVSVYATVDRWVGYGIAPFTFTSPATDALPSSGSRYTAPVVGALLALTTLLGLWLFRGPYDPRHRSTVAEWSTVFLVASLFGTVTWKAYFVVLLLPMTLFVATWRDQDVEPAFRRRLQILTWSAFVLSLAGAGDLFPGNLAVRMQMAFLLTVMGLGILGILFWYRSRVSRVTTPVG